MEALYGNIANFVQLQKEKSNDTIKHHWANDHGEIFNFFSKQDIRDIRSTWKVWIRCIVQRSRLRICQSDPGVPW